MKQIKIGAAWFAAALLAACATPTSPGVTTIQTPSEIAAQVCPPLQTALTGLNALVGLPANAKADLVIVTPLVAGVCAAGATVNAANLKTLQQSALPALMNAVQASGMEAEQQNALILDLTAAQFALSAVEQASAQTNAQAGK